MASGAHERFSRTCNYAEGDNANSARDAYLNRENENLAQKKKTPPNNRTSSRKFGYDTPGTQGGAVYCLIFRYS
jgi:hypothetical protein